MNLPSLPPFQHVRWDPDLADRRRFGASMAVGFAVIGLLVAWRRHEVGTAAYLLWGIGAALAAGALLPGLGRLVYLAVTVPTSLVGYVISHVLLTVIFFLLFTPLAFLIRLSGRDLLRLRRPQAGSHWLKHEAERHPQSYYRQF